MTKEEAEESRDERGGDVEVLKELDPRANNVRHEEKAGHDAEVEQEVCDGHDAP